MYVPPFNKHSMLFYHSIYVIVKHYFVNVGFLQSREALFCFSVDFGAGNWYNSRALISCSKGVSCVEQDPFLSGCGKKRFLDSKERQPEEVSSGLHAKMGNPRAEPGSPLLEWGVAWAHRIPLVRCIVLLTLIVPRSEPAARRAWTMTQAAPSADGCAMAYRLSDRTCGFVPPRAAAKRHGIPSNAISGLFLSYTGRGAFFLFGQEPKRKNGGRIIAARAL